MLLDTTAAPQPVTEQIPFWLTVSGQLVISIITAIIPCLFTAWREHGLLKKIEDLRQRISHSFDKASFADERSILHGKLSAWQKDFQARNFKLGVSSLTSLEQLLVRIQSYSKRIPFSSEDQEIVDSLLSDIKQTVHLQHFNEFAEKANGRVENIKLILEKGDYRI